jgi:hypothetical protein
MKTMRKNVARVLLIVLVLLTLVLVFLSYGVYSEGTRAGFVIKVSKKGIVIKTWEGQLNLQSFGASNPRNAFSEVFDFSVKRGDTATYQLLQEVSLTGERINLHYEEKYVALPWLGDTRYFVTRIDRLDQLVDPQRKNPLRENRPERE